MDELIVQVATKYPLVIAIFSAIGVLRAIMKPLFALFRSYVTATETKKDDAVLDTIEQSKFYKGFLFVLDWLTSIKLQHK